MLPVHHRSLGGGRRWGCSAHCSHSGTQARVFVLAYPFMMTAARKEDRVDFPFALNTSNSCDQHMALSKATILTILNFKGTGN